MPFIFSETFVIVSHTTQHHIPEDSIIYSQLKCDMKSP
jgi:hypothetical protein